MVTVQKEFSLWTIIIFKKIVTKLSWNCTKTHTYIGPNHLLPMELISAAREALSLSRSKPSWQVTGELLLSTVIVAGCCRSASKISTKWFGIKLATIFTKFLLLQKLYFHKTLDGFITGWQKNWLTVW